MELLLFALGILIFDFLLEKNEKSLNAAVALLGVAASAFGLFFQARQFNSLRTTRADVPGLFGFQSTVIVDGFSLAFYALFLAAAARVILLSPSAISISNASRKANTRPDSSLLHRHDVHGLRKRPDRPLPRMEIMALSLYVLSGYLRREPRSNEAALKYFLLGGFSTGILAYGFSILYGLSGSTNVLEIGNILDRRFQFLSSKGMMDWLVVLALPIVATGLFFKVAAAPFHQWAPDVYEGAPTPVAAYISVASMVASFALLLRLFIWVFGGSEPVWQYLVAGVAVASIAWGTLAALTQSNLKRLLAYSSIAHVGYILLGLVAISETAVVGMLYYVIAYIFMTIGAFAILVILHQRGQLGEELNDLNGLYQRSPAAALLLLIFMLSLAGIPPTAGFMGKYFILPPGPDAPSRPRDYCRALHRARALLLPSRCRPRVDQQARRIPSTADEQRPGCCAWRGPLCHFGCGAVS